MNGLEGKVALVTGGSSGSRTGRRHRVNAIAPGATVTPINRSWIDDPEKHEVDNVYVVDASFFVSSSAVNPTLTIIANALRVADHVDDRLAGVKSGAAGRMTGGPMEVSS